MDVTAVNTAILASGYSLQEVAGKVFVTQEESTAPFYYLYSVVAAQSLYTMNVTEANAALAAGHTNNVEHPVMYIYPTQICESTPFYRLRGSNGKDNFYTTSESERIDYIPNQGYVDINTAGYILRGMT